MVADEVMLVYSDFSKPFHLWSDSSDYQLGETLVQEDSDGKVRPLGFYTRKLNSAPLNYNVSEKELLGIIEFMKAFQGMILGFELILHTDHLNFLYHKLPNQRMCRWKLMMEEFHPTVLHCAGIENDSADALSRLPMKRKREDEIEWEARPERLHYSNYNNTNATNSKPREERKIETQFMMITKALVEIKFESGDT